MIDIWSSFDNSHSSNWEMAKRFLDGCNIAFDEDLIDVLRLRPWNLVFEGDVDALDMRLIQGFRPKEETALGLGIRAARGLHKAVQPYAFLYDERFLGNLVTEPIRMKEQRFVPGYQSIHYGDEGLTYEQRRPSETIVRTESFVLGDNGILNHNLAMQALPDSSILDQSA